jgi:hypothetical protein
VAIAYCRRQLLFARFFAQKDYATAHVEVGHTINVVSIHLAHVYGT